MRIHKSLQIRMSKDQELHEKQQDFLIRSTIRTSHHVVVRGISNIRTETEKVLEKVAAAPRRATTLRRC